MNSLSILMTTYNSEKFVKESINSILNQDYKDFELIVVDDFSDDNTLNIIKNITDKRIKLYSNPEKGRGNALTYGLRIASSKFIALNDSDDISVPYRLSRQLDYLRNKPDNYIVSTNFACFKGNKLLYEFNNPENSDEIKKSFAMHCRFMNSGVMYNREHILKHGAYKNIFSEDYELWLRIMSDSEFYNIQDVLMFVRLRNDSLSLVNQKNHKMKDSAVYDIQEKNIDYGGSIHESDILKGWREFFYGKSENARKYWLKAGIHRLFTPRIFTAFILTYFPESFLIKFKNLMLRYRIKYYLGFFSKKNIALRRLFREILKSVR